MLGTFPEGYRLYEHRREANRDNPEEKGGGDRSDVYLYGYPQGRKKRFRSPNDFFHHMLWLATDDNADPENCECKFCATDEQQKAFSEILKWQEQKLGIKVGPSGVKQSAKPPAVPQTKDRPPESRQTSISSQIAVEVPKRTPSLPAKSPSLTSQSLAPTAQLASPTIATPTPPVQLTNPEQILDAQPNRFIFRPGEVVWYQRGNDRGGAVGLAVVTGREILRNVERHSRAAYNVQPLSHPFSHPSIVFIKDEQFLKPWLAFSPPENFHKSLRPIHVAYDQIPWQQLLDGIYGEGDTESDGSIFAAKTVDASYTPFDPLPPTSQDSTKYNGIFLGGEKIWRGEALRLKHGDGKDIMILSSILETTPATPPQTQQQPPGQKPTPDLFFIGDIYTYRSNPQPSKQMPRNTYLPARVQQDLEFRNAASMSLGKGSHYWKFIKPLARLSAAEIKGRWYESRSMIPILHSTEVLANAVREGAVDDIGDSLNSHGDSSAIVAPAERRRGTREEAFGGAVPGGTVFGGGLSGMGMGTGGVGGGQKQARSPKVQQQGLGMGKQGGQGQEDTEMRDYGGGGQGFVG